MYLQTGTARDVKPGGGANGLPGFDNLPLRGEFWIVIGWCAESKIAGTARLVLIITFISHMAFRTPAPLGASSSRSIISGSDVNNNNDIILNIMILNT